MIPLTEDTFRRLTQSSPWRFTRLHFTWHPGSWFDPVEARLTRPDDLVVRLPDGRTHTVEGRRDTAWALVAQPDGSLSADPTHLVPPEGQPARIDEHGLVVVRPDDRFVGYDDPMWQTYTWVAMLDPRELADGTTVEDLAETERFGRRTWWATMSAVDGEYEPRCGCCPLLWGEVSERAELAAGGPAWVRQDPDVVYPAEWLIGVDVATGIVVSAEPSGGSRPDAGFTVSIHEVG